ncbi:hypothetical protein LTS09_007988 [Friedmanniomyces endolithicus]|nr:hypothetical protein LTS09_007988 [Friedmanniomyces endolithicus]
MSGASRILHLDLRIEPYTPQSLIQANHTVLNTYMRYTEMTREGLPTSSQARSEFDDVGSGDAKQSFYVHGEWLTTYSEFFAAAMRKEWKEGQERVVPLPEDEPEIFKILASFLYTGIINSVKADDRDGDEGKDREYQRLMFAWFLGNKLLCIAFQNAVIDALIEKLMENPGHPPLDLHREAYSITVGSCGMRRLVVDVAVFIWPKGQLAKAAEFADCTEFYRDVLARYVGMTDKQRRRNPSFYGEGDCCLYHDHGDRKCYKTVWR